MPKGAGQSHPSKLDKMTKAPKTGPLGVVEESQEIIAEGWKCPDCKRRFPAPITTYISPIDGKERCAECAERQTRK